LVNRIAWVFESIWKMLRDQTSQDVDARLVNDLESFQKYVGIPSAFATC
jgi:hypothetical protein